MESGYFSEWLKSYRNYLRMRNYSPRTLNSYEQVLRHFAYYVWLRRHTEVTRLVIYWKDFEKARLDTDVEVTPVIITDFLSFVSTMQTYKPKTFHRIISTLSLVLSLSLYPGCSNDKPFDRYRSAANQATGSKISQAQSGSPTSGFYRRSQRQAHREDHLCHRCQGVRALQHEHRRHRF